MLKVLRNKKLAICLSGSLDPRHATKKRWPGAKICADLESLRRLFITPYEPDIFCFFWAPEIVRTESAGHYLQRLKPVRYKIESQMRFIKTNNFGPAMRSQHYAVHQANNLRIIHEQETGTTYDLVIRTRPDLTYTDISFELPLEKFLYTPEVKVGTLCQDYGGINDQFAIGPPDLITILSNMWTEIDNIDQPSRPRQFGDNPEKVLMRYLQGKNLPLRKIDINYNLTGREGAQKD